VLLRCALETCAILAATVETQEYEGLAVEMRSKRMAQYSYSEAISQLGDLGGRIDFLRGRLSNIGAHSTSTRFKFAGYEFEGRSYDRIGAALDPTSVELALRWAPDACLQFLESIEKALVRSLYVAGLTIHEIAAKVGKSGSWVYTRLSDKYQPKRKRDTADVAPEPVETVPDDSALAQELEAVRAMRVSGMTYEEIAQQLHRSISRSFVCFEPNPCGVQSTGGATEFASMDGPVDTRSGFIKNHGQKFTLSLIKRLARGGHVTLMCHCAEDQTQCHRHELQRLIQSNRPCRATA
jgi:hypothetical protein